MVVTTTYYAEPVARDEQQYEWVLEFPYRDSGDTSNFYESLIKTVSESFARKRADLSIGKCSRFDLLVEQWHEERGASSSIGDIIACPAYHKIIAMGADEAVELILKRLRAEGDDPDHWFWALQILTGADPVPDEDEGNLQSMANAWLAWGTEVGYAA